MIESGEKVQLHRLESKKPEGMAPRRTRACEAAGEGLAYFGGRCLK
jgi:hypothetical protein